MIQAALVRCGFTLADIRGLTMPEAETFLALFAGRAAGTGADSGSARRLVPASRKKRND